MSGVRSTKWPPTPCREATSSSPPGKSGDCACACKCWWLYQAWVLQRGQLALCTSRKSSDCVCACKCWWLYQPCVQQQGHHALYIPIGGANAWGSTCMGTLVVSAVRAAVRPTRPRPLDKVPAHPALAHTPARCTAAEGQSRRVVWRGTRGTTGCSTGLLM